MTTRSLHNRVMRRVYIIWCARKLTSPMSLKVIAFALLAWELKEAVFVRQVFANMANYKASELFDFWSAAFLHTDFIVQGAVLGVSMLAVLLFWDVLSLRREELVFARNS